MVAMISLPASIVVKSSEAELEPELELALPLPEAEAFVLEEAAAPEEPALPPPQAVRARAIANVRVKARNFFMIQIPFAIDMGSG